MSDWPVLSWRRRIVLFLISQCITLFGSTLVQMAIVWYVTVRTASGMWTAAFSAASYLPQFAVSFAGGVFADRYSRKVLIIGADGAIAFATLVMIAVLPKLPDEQIVLAALLCLSVLRSAFAGIQTPAVNAVIPSLVPPDELLKYNGMNAAMQSAVQFLSPAAAAVVFAVSSLPAVLVIDVATAAVGISLFCCLSLPENSSGDTKPDVLFSGITGGLKYVCSYHTVSGILIIFGLYIFLSVPAGFLSGLYVRRTFGETYWYLSAAELIGFAGMTAGGFFVGLLNRYDWRSLLRYSLVVFGACAVCMSFSHNFVVYLSFMLLFGIALTVVQTVLTTALQEHCAPEMQGRVFGLQSSLYAACLPLGMIIFGFLADCFPLSYSMIFSGAALIVLAAAVRKI